MGKINFVKKKLRIIEKGPARNGKVLKKMRESPEPDARPKLSKKKLRVRNLLEENLRLCDPEIFKEEALNQTHTDDFFTLSRLITPMTHHFLNSGIPSESLIAIRDIWRLPSKPTDTKPYKTCAGVSLKKADIYTLRIGELLNDEVIYAYLQLIKKRSEEVQGLPKVYCFNTFFYPAYFEGGYTKVARWTKNVNIFEYDLVFVPIFHGEHWSLLIWDFRNKCKIYLDSLEVPEGEDIRTLATIYFNMTDKYLKDEAKSRGKDPREVKKLKKIVVNRPIQRNETDCGVYVCLFAEYVARGCTCFDFFHDFIYKFRAKICHEILAEKLMWTLNGPRPVKLVHENNGGEVEKEVEEPMKAESSKNFGNGDVEKEKTREIVSFT
uniref:ULP_PROTEASE domain-containing protein n=1 Tax=Bursaphelenchus xylophilus TaxID=6326 RepID=A0A1I7RYL9_BURXY